MSFSPLAKSFKNEDLRQRTNYLLRHKDLEHKKRIRTVTADYTITLEDHTIVADGTLTATLPKAYNGAGYIFHIVNKSGTTTLEGDGSETINGSLSMTYSNRSSITVQSDGTEWIIL